ncbi:MAG: hypothetical protein JKY71_04235 [Alphaproteobacteria bacterium]|nr:hypothetical protein [Alphaproteobacteria bacterium]
MSRASVMVTGVAAIASQFLAAIASAQPSAAEHGLSNSDNMPHQGMMVPGHAEAELIKSFCTASDAQSVSEKLLSPVVDAEGAEPELTGSQWSTALIEPLRKDPYFADILEYMDQNHVHVCRSDTLGAPSKMVKFGDDGMFLQLDPSRSVTGLQRQRIPAGDGGAMFAMLTALRTEMTNGERAPAPVTLNEVGLQSMGFNPLYSLDDNHLKLRASYIDHILYIAEASMRLKEVAGDDRLHDFLRQFPYPDTTAVGLARDMEDALRATMDENNNGEITAYNRRAVFDEFFTKDKVFVSLDTSYPKAFLGQLARNGYNAELGRDAVLPQNYGGTPMTMQDLTSGELGERHNGNYLGEESGRNILTSDYYRLPPFDVDNALAMMQVRHALGNARYSKPARPLPGVPSREPNGMEASYTPI